MQEIQNHSHHPHPPSHQDIREEHNHLQQLLDLQSESATSPQPHKYRLPINNEYDLKTRQQLSELLSEQMDKNEQLQKDNIELEEQQRKLLMLLDAKTALVQKLKTEIKENQLGEQSNIKNESTTMYQSHDHNDHSQQIDRLEGVNQTLKNNLKEKQKQMNKMRQHFMEKFDQLQARRKDEHVISEQLKEQLEEYREIVKRQSKQIKQLMDEALQPPQQQNNNQVKQEYDQMKQEYDQMKQEYEHRIQQLLQQIAQKEQSKQNEIQKVINKYKRQISQLKQTHQNNGLISEQQEVQQHRQMLDKLKKEHNCEIQMLEAKHEEKIEELQRKYANKINHIISQHKQQQQYQQKQKQFKDQQINQHQEQVYTSQQKLRNMMIKYQEQCQAAIKLQEEAVTAKQNYNQVKQQYDQLLQKYQEQKYELDELKAAMQQSEQAKQSAIKQKQSIEKTVSILKAELNKKTHKNSQRIAELENSEYSLQLQIQDLQAQIQQSNNQTKIANKHYKLKEDEIKRLTSKQQKQSILKDQYIQQLQSKLKELNQGIQQMEESKEQQQQKFNNYYQETKNYLNKLREELHTKTQQKDSIQKQNASIKSEVKSLQQKMSVALKNAHNKNVELTKKHENLSKSLREVLDQKQSFRELYDNCREQMKQIQLRNQAQINKYKDQHAKIKDQLENKTLETQYLKEEILQFNLSVSEREQLQVIKKQLEYERNRNTVISQKQANTSKQVKHLQNSNYQLTNTNNQLSAQLINTKKSLQETKSTLKKVEGKLKERSLEIQKNMPYLNQVLEEKKNIELELQKKKNEIKKMATFLDAAKHSKAQEIHGLAKEVEIYRTKIHDLEDELKNDKSVIERFNRQKVNMLRENTVREDIMRKIEQQKKSLEKDKKILETELKKSQNQVEELMQYFQSAEDPFLNSSYQSQQQSFSRKPSKRR